jgi:hypothetical protein
MFWLSCMSSQHLTYIFTTHTHKVSGTTNEKGEATVGYNPLNDADWLIGELNDW